MNEVVVASFLHAVAYPDGAITLMLGSASIPLTNKQATILEEFLRNRERPLGSTEKLSA